MMTDRVLLMMESIVFQHKEQLLHVNDLLMQQL